ncbi:MAG: alpha-galactosidase [Victivallales bacterium]
MCSLLGNAVDMAQDSLKVKSEWLKQTLLCLQNDTQTEGCLTVLANHDQVQQNIRGNKLLRIVDKEYKNGLFCHAVSKILVTLPSPGKKFSAVVGIDNNSDTRSGRGSVIFSVTAGEKTLFKSGVMRVETPGIPVEIDLDGAMSFIMEVGDAGDGIGWDQSDWVEAKVVLANGRELWLGDLPLATSASQQLPFSFKYGEADSQTFLRSWNLNTESRKLDSDRIQHRFVWTDPKSGLEVRCVAVEYLKFPTVEWTLYFRNTGTEDTPILSKIKALDTKFPRGRPGYQVLHYFEGGFSGPHAYRPLEAALSKDSSNQSFNGGGRGSDRYLPYFNLEYGEGGVIFAIGWPGQWLAELTDAQNWEQRVTCGQELTHFLLHPGEEVRSPLIAMQFWKGGDWIDAQNVWRRWMITHNMPTQNGKPLKPQNAGCSSHLFNEMINANEENQIQFVTRHVSEGLKIDYWWMDAGWYLNNGRWDNTGTWEVDTKRFPRGLRAISDVAHSKGVKTIVWFEPERVTPGTWLWDKHPEWLLGKDQKNRLLDLGNKEAWKWLVDHIDRIITEQGIDLYRQDFNINPLGIWRSCDAPDRQGITEIHYNEGYLAYWDELRRRHPGMLIDSCSSGGRRNDLETLRRSVPLLRSDDIGEPVNEQCHTYGLAFWVPYWGTGAPTVPYQFRSCMGWHMTIGPDARRKDENYAEAVRLVTQWREVAENYTGDYYPLTEYSLSERAWMGFQFNRPELGEGMILAYRRPYSPETEKFLKLRGLDPSAKYEFKDADTGKTAVSNGKDLMTQGFHIESTQAPQAVLITYKRIGK